jgi:hypothetical protein
VQGLFGIIQNMNVVKCHPQLIGRDDLGHLLKLIITHHILSHSSLVS